MKFEMPHDESAANEQVSDNVEGENVEGEKNPELKEQVEELNDEAETVGEQLDDVEPGLLSPEQAKKVWENVTRVFGAIYMVVGSAAAAYAIEAMTDPAPLSSFEKVLANGVAIAGIAVGVNGFQKLLHGTKKFFEDLTPEQKAEIKS